ncbi:YheC/YheD family protein [Bacillus suaedaesalsae]|uniref:YheC/YheD family protein n=1 Tax=Bacillus suaedaesalsae TaxID=2810349 RepID=A0ABS2DH28_9BACI|nr:YheC/YheD family protein [Bacillus suaedaesalsae]MBM6617777.1 YheC/YheD family protein [Bacillus suaedaesalsae]
MKNTVMVKELHGETMTVKLPPQLFRTSLGGIGFGTMQLHCSITVHSDNSDVLYMSSDIISELNLPLHRTLHYFIHHDIFHIGPLIGIFTAGFTDSLLRPIGERSLFFAKLLSTEKSVGVCAFVFGAHLINWDEGTVTGYFYNEKEGWTKQNIPLPNVIYDRLPNRRTENHSGIKSIKHRLQSEYLIPWYNPGFFSKWDLYQQLIQDKHLNKYLPETLYQPSFKDIEQMVKKHKHVYIKPANGSLGLGIYQVVMSDEGTYYCRYKDGEENRLQKFSSLKKLISYLFRHKNLDQYLVQQGIDLIRYENRAVDFRIHTNRDENGTWRMTALAAKIAGRGSVTTHLNNGGMIKTLEELFPAKETYEQLNSSLQNTVLQFSQAISERTNGCIGEIGFDIGLDREGHIWLFEANSKPGRSIFSHPKLRMQDRLTRELSMSFAIYLTRLELERQEVHYK